MSKETLEPLRPSIEPIKYSQPEPVKPVAVELEKYSKLVDSLSAIIMQLDDVLLPILEIKDGDSGNEEKPDSGYGVLLADRLYTLNDRLEDVVDKVSSILERIRL